MTFGMQGLFGFGAFNQISSPTSYGSPYGMMGMQSQGMLGGYGQMGGFQGGMGIFGMMPLFQYNGGKAWDTTLESTLGRRDPVYLDTNGDGQLNKERLSSPLSFDINGDGIMDQVHEWNSKDAQLVFDANGDGKINDGKEMMNEVGVNGEQGKYKNGWEKARDLFDANKDGILNGDELKNVKLWTDANGDGKVDEGEMKSAADSNLVGIDTNNGEFMQARHVGNMFFGFGMGFSGWGGGFGGYGGGFGGYGGGFGGGFPGYGMGGRSFG